MSIDEVPTEKALKYFDELLGTWEDSSVDGGQRQTTLLQHEKKKSFRLDRQGNGDFSRQVDGESIAYRNFAIQDGNSVYASVNIPVEKDVGASLIREAFTESRDRRLVATIAHNSTTSEPFVLVYGNAWQEVKEENWEI